MLDQFFGRYVIVRSSASGCHAGVLESANITGDTVAVVLRESRRLWRWWAAAGVGLGGVAEAGLRSCSELRIGVQMSEALAVGGCCEVLICSAKGEASIRACEVRS